ncbi:MAG: VOC family protein [Thermoplasmata archaeon]
MESEMKVATLMPIRNMDRAIKFYTKSLGAKIQYKGEEEMADNFASLELGGTEIWLINPEKREKRTLAYTSLLVNDIKSTVGDLKRKGVKFRKAERMGKETKVDGPIAFESFGASAFFNDTEGNLIMIWQNSPSM